MWRSSRVVACKKYLPSRKKCLPKRLYATSSSQSGGGKGLITLITTAALGTGGVIAYAKYDPKFRKMVEENVPYSDVILKSLPEWERETKLPTTEPNAMSEKIKEKSTDSGLLKKKLERQQQQLQEVKSTKPDSEIATKVTVPALDKENKTVPIEQKNELVEQKSSSKILVDNEVAGQKRSVTQETDTAAINVGIEKSIKDLLEKVDRLSQETIQAQKSAVEAIQHHTKTLYHALEASEDAEGEQKWNQVNIASANRIAAVNLANQKHLEARAVTQQLREAIDKGHASSKGIKNPILYTGEETLSKVLYQIQSGEAEITATQAEAKAASDYKTLVDKGKEQFKKELEAVLPKGHSADKGRKMSEEDLNLLIAHAHKRIEQLQKQLAKQQATEMQRVQESVLLQKSEDEKVAVARIAVEMKKQQKELESEFEKKLILLNEEFEAEMRQQLRRQAAAHADHLQDALHVQLQELQRKHNQELEDKILHQKGIFISEISESMAKLKGIEGYLKARAELDVASRKAQALWLACQAMKFAIKVGESGEPRPLSKELAAIKSAANDDSMYVSTILAGIPSEAVQRGVYSEESLKQRFEKVKRICCRVAMIDDNGGSLFQYFLSFMQSFLLYEVKAIPKDEIDGKVAVDTSEWDTFDILSRVSFCLRKDDLEQALRYANQLKGEPRFVAKDWVKELRLLLEAKQAADALMAHAAAIAVQAYN